MNTRNFLIIIVAIFSIVSLTVLNKNNNDNIPIVAIANYGPHSSLDAAIIGIKQEMTNQGFVENKTIRYEISHVGFDPTLIPQMIAKLKNFNPKLMVVLTTPVAQFAKNKITDIPLVYASVTDPVEAGLIEHPEKSLRNITGSSDLQNLDEFLKFAKNVFPNAKKVGVLYSTSESNDATLVKMMKKAALNNNISVFALPIDQTRDIYVKIKEFRSNVDFIYVGASGPIQPALSTIAIEAYKMGIPVFNVENQAVKDGLTLASFGVNYESIGKNAGKLVASILKGKKIDELVPQYPKADDHFAFINQKQIKHFNALIPKNTTIVGG